MRRIEPLGNEFGTGYSDFDKQEVAEFYGQDGAGPLYQCEGWFNAGEPLLSRLSLDVGKLNYWADLARK